MMKLIVLSFLFLLALACGSGESNPDAAEDSSAASLPLVELAVVDSIGVELGDSNYVMGAIEGLAFGPDGNIMVLDRARSCIRVYSPEGEFLRQIGSKGSGPGELQDIAFLAVSQDGHVYCAGEGSGVLGVHQYDYETGEWLGSYSTGSPPTNLESSWGNGYVRKELEPYQDQGQFMVLMTVSRFELDSEEPSVVYFESEFPFDPTDMARAVELVWEGGYIATAPDSCVYFTERSTEEAVIYAWDGQGNERFQIEMELEAVPRTEEEIEMERLILQARGAVMGMDQVQLEPDPLKPLIRGLETDGDGNLWVLEGGPSNPTFDVFSPQGEPLFTATLRGDPPDGSTWRFHFGDRGILAYADDPACGYQKVYMLNVEEPEQD